MAFEDGLADTANFFTITTAQNALGQEIKSEVVLYTGIRCRLGNKGGIKDLSHPEGTEEAYNTEWVVMVETIYNGADRGDRVVVNNQRFLITKKQTIKGTIGQENHIVYYLKEQE